MRNVRPNRFWQLLVSCPFLFVTSVAMAAEASFEIDVMAVLSKNGCNLGSCHGNQNGKGGLKLSLRGQDARQDYHALVGDLAGRRVNRVDPAKSLVLLKASAGVPHEGGQRFQEDSESYQAVLGWIAAGVPEPSDSQSPVSRLVVSPPELIVTDPEDSVQLAVTAHFASGEARDVTTMAVYEPSTLSATVSADGLVKRTAMGETTIAVRYLNQQVPVRVAFIPNRPDFRWADPSVHNYIDEFVHGRLKQLRINPSKLTSDHQFVRRSYLDALGILPSADEARSFVEDSSSDKRSKLIDHLLQRPEFADHWALKWSDLLRNEEKVLDPTGVDAFHSWIKDWFVQGKPLDEFVRRLIVGRGSTYKNPAANFYRANRDPQTRAEVSARLFLGIRLQCAQCHNHPFDRWSQDDYYSWAAVFARVDYDIIENKRLDRLDKNEFQGEQIVRAAFTGEVTNARTQQIASPRLLGVDRESALDESQDRLHQLADWLVSSDNRQFAKAQANRIFFHLMGRGLVEPIDDFRATNPASIPGLLDRLATDFIESGFDVRHLVHTIMNSRTYQTASDPNRTNTEDQLYYSRAIVKRLTAEQLLDAQCQALGIAPRLNGYPEGTRAGQMAGVKRVRRRDGKPMAGDRFLTVFGKPQRLLPCECERSNETTLSQAFLMISGQGIQERLSHEDNLLARLVASDRSNQELIEELYWSILSRPPSDDEVAAIRRLFDDTDNRLEIIQDVAWAMLNSKEFIFRR